MNFKYIVAISVYSALRKGVMLRDATIEHYDRKNRESIVVPMLTSTKTAITIASVVMGQAMWPIWLYQDIQYLEMQRKRLEPSHYGFQKPTNPYEYAFV